MKKINPKLKTSIISSFLIIAVLSAPLISFANDNGKDGDNYHGKTKIEQAKLNANIRLADHSNSIWNKLFGWFGQHANAQTKFNAEQKGSSTPVISSITAPTVLSTGQTGKWTINASDPQNGTLSYMVNWGEVAPFATNSNSLKTSFVQTSTFTHSYDNPGTYTIRFTVRDEDGLQTTSTTTVNVRGMQIAQAPVISNLTAISNEPTHATINWTTDVRASSLVWFSTTSPVDTSATPNVARRLILVRSHNINLNKLTPNTKYYVVIGSGNGVGRTLSNQISFTTPDTNDNTTPVITSLTGPSTIALGSTETITINAYDPKDDSLTYTANWGDNAPSMMSLLTPEPPFVQTSTFSHVYSDVGTYTATFTAQNSSGKEDTSTLTITVTPTTDTTPPSISDIHSNTGQTSTTITWTTDEPTTSKIFFSTGMPVDVNTSPSVIDDTFSTSHSLNITGLSASTLYHFIVESTDAGTNKTDSSESAFTTSS